MKVVFLLDNSEYVEVAPEKLQIRQIAQGQSALGVEVQVPLLKEDKTPDLDEKGVQKTQVGFRPFINYAVNLSVPTPEQPAATQAPVQAAPVPEVKAAKGGKKAKAAKRRVN
jgi:hypothetical protein